MSSVSSKVPPGEQRQRAPTSVTVGHTGAEAAAKHEADVVAYDAAHHGYRTWLAEAAAAKAGAATALRGRKSKCVLVTYPHSSTRRRGQMRVQSHTFPSAS